MVLKTEKKKNLSNETVFLLACFQNMSGWEIMLFSLFLPTCFWQTTWCSDSRCSCTNPICPILLCPVYLCFVKTRCPFSLFCLCSTHPISYLKLCGSQVSLFRWASPHINTWITQTLQIVLTLCSLGKEKAWKAYVYVWWQSTERERRLLRPQMKMEVDFSLMLEGSFSPESN